MDIQEKKETLSEISQESITLGSKALYELSKDGTTSVICPKCNTSPRILTGSCDERIKIGCDCGYIWNMEIYF